MSVIDAVLQVIGTIAVYLAVGTGLSYICSSFDRDLRHENAMIAVASSFWPVVIPIILISGFFKQTVPWLKRKWKKFRAPKVAKKEEAKIEKIRMCPALKLKKYEAILNKLSDSRERRYCDQMHGYLKEFERIRDGKPEAKVLELDVRPGEVHIVPHDQVNFAAQAAQQVAWAMPMPDVMGVAGPEQQMYRYR